MKVGRTLTSLGQHWSILWIFSFRCISSVPDPDAFHELSNEEFESFMRDLHPPRAARYDTEVARSKRQAGVQNYEYDSDDVESGPWDDWEPQSACSR